MKPSMCVIALPTCNARTAFEALANEVFVSAQIARHHAAPLLRRIFDRFEIGGS